VIRGFLRNHPLNSSTRGYAFAAAEPPVGEPGAGGGGGGGGAAPKTGGKGNGQRAGGADSDIDVPAILRQNAELAKQVEALSTTVRNLETESIGRKKRLQHMGTVLGDMTPEEVQAQLDRAHDLEQAEQVRKGEFDTARAAWQTEKEKLRNTTLAAEKRELAAEKREAQRMKEAAILAGAAANSPLTQALQVPPGGTRSTVVLVTDDLFEYEVETGATFHKTERDEGSGKRLTPTQFFAQERTKSLAYLFASGVLPGGSAAAKDAEGGAGDVVEIQHDDPDKVVKLEAAEKAGKKTRIVRRA